MAAPIPPSPPLSSIPVVTHLSAYASDGVYLYTQGGIDANGKDSKQFFALNLTTSWASSSPAWIDLGDREISGRAGGLIASTRAVVVLGKQSDPSKMYVSFLTKDVPIGTSVEIASNVKQLNDIQTLVADSMGNILALGIQQQLTVNATGSWDTSKSMFPAVPNGQAAVWFDQSLYFTGIDSSLQEFKFDSTTKRWSQMSRGGAPQIQTKNHCMLGNAAGTEIYVVGGTAEDNVHNNAVKIKTFHLANDTWTIPDQVGSPNARESMACAVAGDYIVIWGGSDPTNSGQRIDEVLLFNTAKNSWEATYTPPKVIPPPKGPLDGPSSQGGGVIPEPTPPPKPDEESNLPAIIGGAVGGVVVLILIAGFFLYRRRSRRQSGKHGSKRSASESNRGLVGAAAGGKRSRGGMSAGESAGSDSVELGGYTAIQSPFAPDDPETSTLIVDRSMGAPVARAHHQQQYSSSDSFQSGPPKILSPFDPEPVVSAPYPPQYQQPTSVPFHPSVTSPSPPLAPLSSGFVAPTSHPFQQQQEKTSRAIPRNREPATVDLIPIEPSEAGDSLHSRSNSLLSTGRSAYQSVSGRRSGEGREGGTGKEGSLLGYGGGSRRDSTETLDYLEIS